ncbi:ATP-binding protein [Aeromicrobium sp. IC_218]|nr:ATP-binding protein [Aeromicrobium sp. IC_218]
MCGPSGSGKSTYARGLEAGGMVRLSFDHETWRRGLTAPLSVEAATEIEAVLRARLLELVRSGTDVVLDFSFSTRALRDDYRALLAPLGVLPETVYLATDRDTALARLRSRRGQGGDDLVLDADVAARHFDTFEVPTPDEGPLRVVGDDPERDPDVRG